MQIKRIIKKLIPNTYAKLVRIKKSIMIKKFKKMHPNTKIFVKPVSKLYSQENQDYIVHSNFFQNKDNGLFSFETKRNLITNSAEFYNLSYEYLNACLRAGLVYRREFYNDSELEPENSLMFKITLTPFGNINSPTFSQ